MLPTTVCQLIVAFVLTASFPDVNAAPVLEKREPRGGGALGGAANLASTLIQASERDKENRGQWTKDTVANLRAKDPSYNYAVVHTKHDAKFEGKEGKDWQKLDKAKYDASFGKDKKFDVYKFKKGEITNKGDGGYINWAYNGNVNNRKDKTVKFDAPKAAAPKAAPAAKKAAPVPPSGPQKNASKPAPKAAAPKGKKK